MTLITDLAARKAYLVGQLTEVDGTPSTLSRSQQFRQLWREIKQVDKQLQEAYEEAEANKSQSSVPGVSVQEGTNAAARAVSEDDADNTTSEHSSPRNTAASSSSDTASKTAPRKVTFQLPEASDHESDSEISDTSSSSWTPKAPLNLDEIDFGDPEAFKRFMEYMRPRDWDRNRIDGNENLDGDGHNNADHSVLAPLQSSEDEMEASRTSAESQERSSSGLDDMAQETDKNSNASDHPTRAVIFGTS